MLLLFSYGSYALAETLRLSGIMALFFSGIALAHFNPPNLSVESTTAAHHIFGAFALIAECVVRCSLLAARCSLLATVLTTARAFSFSFFLLTPD